MLQVTEMADRARPAVVGLGRGARRGSGLVVAPERVAVLAHVLRDEEPEVVLAGGRRERATVLGRDDALGVAVLAVPTGDAAPLPWAPAAPRLGDPVLALGDPGGTGLRATEGRVSADPLTFRGRGGRPVEGVIEHTAPLPRGAGGGPLLDAEGRVLGLNAMRTGAGFLLALPAAALRPRLDSLLAGEPSGARRLGVAVAPPHASRRMRRAVGLPDRDGLLVRDVEDGSAAARAGLAAGDLLVRLGGRALATMDDLFAAIDAAGTAGPVAVGVVRGADELELEVAP
jgi:serine protease Do